MDNDSVRQPIGRRGLYPSCLKRPLDLAICSFGWLVTAPLQLGIAAAVAKKLGRPVLHRQVRPGLNGQPFELVKFRTMTDERDVDGVLLPDDLRLTPFGRLLRSTSLDELPELFNVIRGDMSLVGPRPLLMRYLPLYSEEQMRRHDVRPGITGLAQVNGRNNQTWESKFEWDLAYVDGGSFKLDLQILWRTVLQVLARKDVQTPNHATSPPFLGTDAA